MKHNAAPSAPDSSENSSTMGDGMLPSGSRLTLEGIRSLAFKIAKATSGAPNEDAMEIVNECDKLIAQVIVREAQIYEWSSGQ